MAHFEKLLRLFPFSQREEQAQSTVSIQAISLQEPPLLEQPINGPIDVDEVLEIFAGYKGDDVSYRLESWWDLWQLESDWTLRPARVALACFGSEFDNGTDLSLGEQEDLLIDFGVDSRFLPEETIPSSAKLTSSNIRSLLRLVHELDSALPLRKRLLQTESGENFAERLQQILSAGAERPF